MTASAPISFNAGAESGDRVSANTSCWFALRRRTSGRPIAPARPGDQNSHRNFPFSYAAIRSEAQVMLSCKHATHRGSRPVPKPSHNSINCPAASRSLVVDRVLGAVIGDDPGDRLRQFPSSLAGESRFFLGTNRGKRALALDLKQPEGLAVLHRMGETADVLVENFRPSVPARLGIDYPRLKTINPRLVYCGLTGYGDGGPLSEKGGFDQVLQCLSGIAVFQGAAAGTPQVVLGSVLDYFTSALLAYGVAAALYHRERSGQGQYLSLSLLRSALTIQAGRFVWAE